MGLMDSINIQYIWKAIQESERSDENLYPITTLSDRLFQACHSASSFPAQQCACDALVSWSVATAKNTCGNVPPDLSGGVSVARPQKSATGHGDQRAPTDASDHDIR